MSFLLVLARVKGDPGPMYPVGRVLRVSEDAKSLESLGTRDGTFKIVEAPAPLTALERDKVSDLAVVWDDATRKLVKAPERTLLARLSEKVAEAEIVSREEAERQAEITKILGRA